MTITPWESLQLLPHSISRFSLLLVPRQQQAWPHPHLSAWSLPSPSLLAPRSDSHSCESPGSTAADSPSLPQIPQLGFGVYLSPPEVTTQTVSTALQAGYKHIDSAQWYLYVHLDSRSLNPHFTSSHPHLYSSLIHNPSNEQEVGLAAAAHSSPSRSSLFLTTKLGHADRIPERLEESVSKLDPRPEGYVDLFLIHAPTAGPEKRVEQWKALEDLVRRGRARAIGVSN